MTGARFQMLTRPRLQNIAIATAFLTVAILWATGVLRSSDFSSGPWIAIAWLLAVASIGMIASETAGLRHREILVTEVGITAPHGLAWRPTSLRWEEIAEMKVYRVPYGQVLSLRDHSGTTLRIGLGVVDDPEALEAAITERLAAVGGK